MASWIWFLIALVILVPVLASRSRRGVQAMGHGHLKRMGGQRKAVPDQQPQSADDWTTDIRLDPHLEYQGAVYFFCSVEERDRFAANPQFGELNPSETAYSSCDRTSQGILSSGVRKPHRSLPHRRHGANQLDWSLSKSENASRQCRGWNIVPSA